MPPTMSSYNPYEAPQNQPYSPPTQGAEGQITPMMLQHLQDTRPWVLFLSIVGFIAIGLMVVGSLYVMTALGRMIPGWMGVIYLGVAAIYVVPTLTLFRYASAISYIFQGGGTHALEEALRLQRSFWRFVGMLTAILLGLYGLMFAGAMVLGRF
jgi:hypothetical protein